MAFIPPMIAAIGPLLASAGTAAAGAASSATAAMTAAGASSGMGLASSLMSAGGSLLEGVAGARAGEYNADVARMQAQQAGEQGALAASEAIRATNQRTATGRAAAAQSGFENTGSVRDLIDQVERAGYMDALSAVYDGSVRSLSAKNNATQAAAQGENALWGGVFGAGTAALSGVSDYYRRTGAIQMTV